MMPLHARPFVIAGEALFALLFATVILTASSETAAAADPCSDWATLRNAFIAGANNAGGSVGGMSLRNVYKGISPNGALTAGFVPHVVLFAIGAAEDDTADNYWRNNDGCSPLTPHVHADGLGWGTMAVSPPDRNDQYDQIPAFNISHGADILIGKWNARFGIGYGGAGYPQLNNNDPNEIEDWFFAIWGYNGYTCSSAYLQDNNPRDHPSTNYMNWSPNQPRNDFTYQDVVYYYMQNPPADAYSQTGPAGKYYLPLNVGYGPGNGSTPGPGIPSWSSFPAQTCPTGSYLTTATKDLGYGWAYVSELFAADETIGNLYSAGLTVRNVGNNIWYGQGSGAPRLGTAALWRDGAQIGSWDHASPFQWGDWLSSNRIKVVPQQPNDVIYPINSAFNPTDAALTFGTCPGCYTAANPGSTYAEHYVMVLDGATWFPDIGVYFQIAVH